MAKCDLRNVGFHLVESLIVSLSLRDAINVNKVTKLWTFSVRGGGWGAQPHSIAFGGVFPHYKGDSNTTKLTIKRQILAQNDQFNDKTPP